MNDQNSDHGSNNDDGSHDSGSQLVITMLEADDGREESEAADENTAEMKEATAYDNDDQNYVMNVNDDADSFPSVHNSDEMQQVMRDIAFGAGDSDWSDDEVLDEDESFSTVLHTTGSDECNLDSDFDDEDEMLVQLQDDDDDDLIQLQDEHEDQENKTSHTQNQAPQLSAVGEVSSEINDQTVDEATPISW